MSIRYTNSTKPFQRLFSPVQFQFRRVRQRRPQCYQSTQWISIFIRPVNFPSTGSFISRTQQRPMVRNYTLQLPASRFFVFSRGFPTTTCKVRQILRKEYSKEIIDSLEDRLQSEFLRKITVQEQKSEIKCTMVCSAAKRNEKRCGVSRIDSCRSLQLILTHGCCQAVSS